MALPNVLIKDANDFIGDLDWLDGKHKTLENIKSAVFLKMIDIDDEHKLDYLGHVRKHFAKEHSDHSSFCKNPTCPTHTELETYLHVIDRELRSSQPVESFHHRPEQNEPVDAFTQKDKEDLFNFIDELKTTFDNLDAGQEVLFNELQEIKEMTELGKKKVWRQILGTIGDATLSKAVEATFGNRVAGAIASKFDAATALVENAF